MLASEFQTTAFARLGATPVAMSLGDVLPAIQQGAIDGAVSGMTVFTSMSYEDAAKYVTTTGQPYIYIIVEYSTKWRNSLPPDLQKVIDTAAAEEDAAIPPVALAFLNNSRKEWVAKGGELIDLPADEQSAMMEIVRQRRRGCLEARSQARRGLQDRIGRREARQVAYARSRIDRPRQRSTR